MKMARTTAVAREIVIREANAAGYELLEQDDFDKTEWIISGF
jgi:hypothetical protein